MSPTTTKHEYWMFKGDRYIRYSTKSESIITGTRDKTIAEGWPGLRGHEFANGIDAITRTGTRGEYWMFKGGRYVRYSTNTESIHAGTRDALRQEGFPGQRHW